MHVVHTSLHSSCIYVVLFISAYNMYTVHEYTENKKEMKKKENKERNMIQKRKKRKRKEKKKEKNKSRKKRKRKEKKRKKTEKIERKKEKKEKKEKKRKKIQKMEEKPLTVFCDNIYGCELQRMICIFNIIQCEQIVRFLACYLMYINDVVNCYSMAKYNVCLWSVSAWEKLSVQMR